MKFLAIIFVFALTGCYPLLLAQNKNELPPAKSNEETPANQKEVSNQEEDAIKQTLIEYMQITKSGKFTKLNKLIAPTPISYIQ